jgi:hypothetical protein
MLMGMKGLNSSAIQVKAKTQTVRFCPLAIVHIQMAIEVTAHRSTT